MMSSTLSTARFSGLSPGIVFCNSTGPRTTSLLWEIIMLDNSTPPCIIFCLWSRLKLEAICRPISRISLFESFLSFFEVSSRCSIIRMQASSATLLSRMRALLPRGSWRNTRVTDLKCVLNTESVESFLLNTLIRTERSVSTFSAS